ncbi:MAG: class I SAM-dependent methyltransferase [Phycisphaerales bacterium]|nr:MAG: class I SAM-dependent methyltransferase [Phycisphaerales bacterium]
MPGNTDTSKTPPPLDETSPCTYCGATLSTLLYRTKSIYEDEFALHRCSVCRAVFLVPKPTPKQVELAYADSYYGEGSKKFGPCVEKALDYFRSSRARKLGKYLKPPAQVLDVGCGSGDFLRRLVDRGFEGYGTELPGKAADRAGKIPGLTLKVGHLSETDFKERSFDAICMWHVFEHLAEPKRTLHIIESILKPGGYLFISLPNINSLQSRLFRGNWLHLDPPRHLFFLGAADLIAELRQLGLELTEQSQLSIEQNVFGIQQSILNSLLSRRDILFEVLKGNLEYISDCPKWRVLAQKLFWVSTFPLFAMLAALEAAVRRGGTMEFVFKKVET